MDYYDAILSLIPIGMGAGGLGALAGFEYAVIIGCALTLPVITHAMFVRPPIDPPLGPHQ